MPAAAPARLVRVDVAKAAAMCDLTPAQLLQLLDRRAALIAAAPAGRYTANPRPSSGVGGDPVWDRDVFRLWAIQMGLTKWRGRYLIGNAGIAVMFGWQEQSVRRRASQDPEFPPRRPGPPPLVHLPIEVAVYDRAEVLAYAIQRAILFPDGRPNVLRPNRGNPFPNRK